MPRLLQDVPSPANNPGVSAQADTSVFADTRSTEAFAQLSGVAAEQIAEIETKRRNRADAINILRLSDQFFNDTQQEFDRTQLEGDIIDPSTADNFSEKVKTKASEYLNKFQGTPEGRLRLEQEITDKASSFIQKMTQNSVNAQKNFVLSKANERINLLVAEVRQDPSKIGDVYKKASTLIDEVSPALYAEDEVALASAAQDLIATTALRSYTDAGQYEEARDLINQNPFFLQSLSAGSQREILSQIDSGIREKEKAQRQVREKITAYRAAAQDLGVDISPNDLFSAATGIEQNQTASAKVLEFERLTGTKATPSVIAKIGFGVNFNEGASESAKNIRDQIQKPFEKASAARVLREKVLGAIELFRQDGNKQALLSAMVSFQKALDEGAVVREGDIVLQREAQGLIDRVSLFLKPGQVVGDELVDEMEATIDDFTTKALEGAKTFIDPFIKTAAERGIHPVDYGIPREAYEQVFAGTSAAPPETKLESGEISADDFLKQ